MTMPSAVRDTQDTTGKSGAPTAGERGGITAWANALWSNSDRGRAAGQDRPDGEGVYVFSEEEAQARQRGGEVIAAPDGYIRRSPVQEMVIPPDYNKRRIKRIVLAVAGVVLAVVAVYLLFRLQVIRF